MVSPSLPECVALIERLAPALLDAAARSVVILGLAGLAALALRRASAAARHWVWLLGVAGILLLPVLSATLPGWHVLPRLAADRAATPPIVTVVIPTIPGPDATPLPNVARSEAPSANTPSPLTTAGPRETAPVQAAASGEPAAPVPSSAAVPPVALLSTGDHAAPMPSPAHAALPWTFWLVLLWLLGSLLVLGQVLLGYLSLWSLQRRCGCLSQGDWPELLGRLRQQLKIHRPVELLSTPLRTMPMTWGLLRTRLLLPEQAASWPPEQRRAVLLHELGHAKRWDCLTQLVAQIACALYWFNPLVWIAWRRIQVERERACDDLVLDTGAKATAYAEHLLHSASAGGMPALRFVGAAVAMARPSTLEERLRAILDPHRNRRALTTWGVLATILLLLAALVPVAALQAQETPARVPAPAAAVPPPPGYPADGTVPLPPGYTTSAGGSAYRPAATAPTTRSGSSGGTTRGPLTPPTPGNGPTCALDATVYEVRLPVDQIGQLDIEALTRAADTPAAFEKALAALGAAKPLYRANQSVRLAGDTLTIGTSVPYITNSQLSFTGQPLNSVSYTQTGTSFAVAGKAGAGGSIELDMTVQVSAMSDGVAISDTVKAPIFRNTTMARKGPVAARQPFVVLSVDAASVDADGKALAYIVRMTLGVPQSGN